MDGIIISVPERAMLDPLLVVPGKITFDDANELMQGAASFCPRIGQMMSWSNVTA